MGGEYEPGLDLRIENDAHTLLVWLSGRDRQVLDVGTGTGSVAEALVKRGCNVTGIEIDPEAAAQAEEHCESVIVGDVESLDLERKLAVESFDVIVLGDVLERLKDPRRTLERMMPLLKPGGYVVASIPNIAHGSVRLALLKGEFEYRSLGLLDNTHLRFFTQRSIEQMFNEAGYAIDILQRVRLGIFETELEIEPGSVPEDTLNMVREDPEAETYQFVLSAYPYSSTPLVAKLTNRLQFLEEQVARRNQLIYELDRKVRNEDMLRRQLDDRERQLATKAREVSNLARDVAARNQRLANLQKINERLRRQVARLGAKPGDEIAVASPQGGE